MRLVQQTGAWASEPCGNGMCMGVGSRHITSVQTTLNTQGGWGVSFGTGEEGGWTAAVRSWHEHSLQGRHPRGDTFVGGTKRAGIALYPSPLPMARGGPSVASAYWGPLSGWPGCTACIYTGLAARRYIQSRRQSSLHVPPPHWNAERERNKKKRPSNTISSSGSHDAETRLVCGVWFVRTIITPGCP
jgi:hypothetical protein